MLGVAVKEFPKPQGIGGFDEVTDTVPAFKFSIIKRPLTGPTPTPSYEKRSIVRASSPDGTIYEAFCGRFDNKKLWPGLGESSSNINTRQHYSPHHGYGYNPADIFIGQREGGRIKTRLFFRDVGSHETAPHHIAVDGRGNVHLMISDVNISDNNELNVYSIIGNPRTGEWLDAWLLDQRGFTSWSHPWSGSWGDSIHSLWNWGDASYDKDNDSMGLFYVEWRSAGFGRKVRVVKGLVETYDAAIDKKSGRVLVVASQNSGVFVVSRDANGVWTKPALLDPALNQRYDVSITALGGAFIIRTSKQAKLEWVLTTKP